MQNNDREFQRKLIHELHDIALSLRELSGRNVVDHGEANRPMSYAEKYFARTTPESDTDET